MTNQALLTLLKRLQRNSSLSMYAHFGAAERNAKAHLGLGLPVLILNIILGSVFVALVSEEIDDVWKWISALLSLISAFLAALLTFFNPQQGKQKHRELANRYLAMDREAELVLASFDDGVFDLKQLQTKVEALNAKYSTLNQDANDYPTSDSDFKRAKKKIKGRKPKSQNGQQGLGGDTGNRTENGAVSGAPRG